jgi:hypothetical protein
MNNIKQTAHTICVPEEELPVRANMRVISRNHPNYGMSTDEVADRNEFIRCYLMREFEALMMIDADEQDDSFYVPDYTVADDGYSAFNTVDFQRTMEPFDAYGYAMGKIMERVKNLAILHSALTGDEGRQNTLRRFNSLIEYEFRERLLGCVDRFQTARTDEQKESLKKKIGELNRRIIECRKIWERHAPRDV